MGTSFIEYKEFGFWSRDSYIESWLTTLIAEMKKLPSLQPWQKSLIDHWQLQVHIDGGWMHLRLDDFLTERAKEQSVISLAKQAVESCQPPGRRTGELFIELLEGRLRTTVSSPIDYLDWPKEPQSG